LTFVLIEALEPLLVRLKDRDIELAPGVPTEIPDDAGLRLLRKAPDMVRVIGVIIEPIYRQARPVYWEDAKGQTQGPADVEFLANVGRGRNETFWVVVTYQGTVRWIRSDRLRAKPRYAGIAKPVPGTPL